MSLEAIVMVSKLKNIAAKDKFVLVALANFADDNLRAFPKQSTLADWTCLTRQTINESLARLEANGYITSVQQRRDDGGYRSKIYDLTPLSDMPTPPVGNPDTPLSDLPTPPVGNPDSNNSHKNSHKGTRKPLSASADFSAKGKASSPKEEQGRIERALAVYNAERGALPSAQKLTLDRRKALKAFIKQCDALSLDAEEVMRRATRLKAKDPHYLGQNDRGAKYGLDAMLRGGGSRAIAFYEQSVETTSRHSGVRVGGRYLFRVSGDDREVVVRSAAPNAPATVVDDDGQMFSVHPGGLRPL